MVSGTGCAKNHFGEAGAVLFLYKTTSVIRSLFEPERIIRCARIGATVLATTVAVLLASFVAIAMGLI